MYRPAYLQLSIAYYAFVAKVLISLAIPLIDFSSACLITGTYNLFSSATAIEILMSLCKTISFPCQLLFNNGYAFKASATAFTKKAKKVKLYPSLFLKLFYNGFSYSQGL